MLHDGVVVAPADVKSLELNTLLSLMLLHLSDDFTYFICLINSTVENLAEFGLQQEYELSRLEILSMGCFRLEFFHWYLDVEPFSGYSLYLIESLFLNEVLLESCLLMKLGLLLSQLRG